MTNVTHTRRLQLKTIPMLLICVTIGLPSIVLLRVGRIKAAVQSI